MFRPSGTRASQIAVEMQQEGKHDQSGNGQPKQFSTHFDDCLPGGYRHELGWKTRDEYPSAIVKEQCCWKLDFRSKVADY